MRAATMKDAPSIRKLQSRDHSMVPPGSMPSKYPCAAYIFGIMLLCAARGAFAAGLRCSHHAVAVLRAAPVYCRSWSFDLLCGGWALAALWVAYLVHLHRASVHERIRAAERARIARDLHDTLLQGIQGLQLRLQTWAADESFELRQRQEMREAAERMHVMLIDGRDRIVGLRRPDTETSFVASLRAIGEDYALLHPARFTVNEEGEPFTLRPGIAAEAIDIIREGLRNAFEHAAASNIELTIRWSRDGLFLYVRDNGCGVSHRVLRAGRRPGHWGLVGMRERAAHIGATMNLRSVKNAGTCLSLHLTYGCMPRHAHLQRWHPLRRVASDC
ncbi:sensor histidine kinase [Rhodanobacter ginsengiterrae]|uniref:sensor histidine kinase n=1 Tax=Rhodanobacter ginsengiterrae TaxID=2008451 RepID=UPI003CED9A73